MKASFIGFLLTALVAVPAIDAAAAARPSLSVGKGRQLIQRFSQGALDAAGGGYATVGVCSRRASWKVDCGATLFYDDETTCTVIFTVWNTPTVQGYYNRRYSHRGLACQTPPPPATTPTKLPLEVATPVAEAYVGGMMNNAHSTSGGVGYCYSIGYTASCSYSYSGSRIADGSYYRCTGNLTINGIFLQAIGWQTTVDYGLGPQCY